MTIPQNVLILAQLGSPEAPTEAAVKKYLREFLGDDRVLDLPPLPKTLLLHGVILRKRPSKVAPKYAQIWTEEGSPLIAHSQKLAAKVQALLGQSHRVELVMRYGEPSLQALLKQLAQERAQSITLLPLFPQQASATTGSMVEALLREIQDWQVYPSLKIIPEFYSHPAFIRAWVEQGKAYLRKPFDKVLFSFHGLPVSQIQKADPKGGCLASPDCCQSLTPRNAHCYRAQAFCTARLIAEGLRLRPDQYEVAFQSRLGKAAWIGPATNQVLSKLAQEEVKKLVVFSPAFVADCLETLEELAIGEKERFLALGGEEFTLVESLNSTDLFAQALVEIIQGKP